MNKKKLNEILNAINGFYLYDDDVAHRYISYINKSLDLVRGIEAHPTSMLDNAKNDAILQLSNELVNRMNENFFHVVLERKKSEFKISRMLVGIALGNVLSNMPSDDEC